MIDLYRTILDYIKTGNTATAIMAAIGLAAILSLFGVLPWPFGQISAQQQTIIDQHRTLTDKVSNVEDLISRHEEATEFTNELERVKVDLFEAICIGVVRTDPEKIKCTTIANRTRPASTGIPVPHHKVEKASKALSK